jgi:putative restriction endonuclease
VTSLDFDRQVRIGTFGFLAEQTKLLGEVLPRTVLAKGFQFQGSRVPLIAPQGIFKPAILPDIPLTITTVPVIEGKRRPYEDEISDGGLIRYRYRGTDPGHRDNVGLRLAMQRKVPLAYFYGITPGQYMPIWPVFIVGDNPSALCFSVAVDEPDSIREENIPDSQEEIRRGYITTMTRQRIHQRSFREKVISAYRDHCTICQLRHRELLDAAHIIPDSDPRGEPVVSNGLSLCKLHHAAFERGFIGIRPDFIIEIRPDILREADGPMLKHGLQGFQGACLLLPRSESLRPNRESLAERYEVFKKVG